MPYFLAAGGLNEEMDNNDHREITLRMCRAGHRMGATKARSYHLTHRTGWRDPLETISSQPRRADSANSTESVEGTIQPVLAPEH